MVNSTPPKDRGPLSTGEMRLAYLMILPTLLIVMSIVLLPLLANFWISFKPVQLGDLRPPAVVANERLRPSPEAAGDSSEISYRLRNASQRGNVSEVVLRDTIPDGLTISGDLDERCELSGASLVCQLGDYEAGQRETLKIPVTATEAFITNPVKPRSSKPVIVGDSDNILTNGLLTLDNYRKIFSASEFWTVLRVSLYYTVFGTIGALVFGLFAAQLLSTTFPGRGILRGFFLFPYVAPVIAVAFAWVLLLDAGPGGTLNVTGGAAGTRTLTVDVYEQAFAVSNLGAGAAVAVVVFIVLLCSALLFFKYSPQDDG